MVLTPASPEDVRECAAMWFARMRRPDAAAFEKEFEAWLAISAEHRAAYNRIAETFSLGKNLTSNLGLNSDETKPQRRTARRAELLFVSAAILLGGGFAAALWNERLNSSAMHLARSEAAAAHRAEFATREGQLRSVRLADGSWVTIDANSRMTATITADARTIRLEAGRARFRVAHDGRPFVVSAGFASIVAHGTVFDVAHHKNGDTFVALLQGSVDVLTRSKMHADAPVVHKQRLTPGHALAVSMQTPASPVDAPVVRNWTDAPIDFDNARLADIIAQANFEAARPIRPENAQIAELRVSGTFRITDTRQLATRVANLFDLQVDDGDAQEIVLRRYQDR